MWNSQVISFKMETEFSFFTFSDMALSCSLLSIYLSLSLPSCRAHTVCLHRAPWLRTYLPLLGKTHCLHSILCSGHLPKKAPKTLPRSRETSWGQTSASSKADTRAKVEYGLFPSSQNFYKLPFLFWHVFLWVLTEPYLSAVCWSPVTQPSDDPCSMVVSWERTYSQEKPDNNTGTATPSLEFLS